MARPPKIRITKRDREDFARLVRNTKAKINRTLKKYDVDLSDEVHIPKNIGEFKTRKEFNQWKRQMESFTNRHNLRYQYRRNVHGVVASKSELMELERMSRMARENARKARRKIQKSRKTDTRSRILKEPDLQGFSMPDVFDFQDIHWQWQLEEAKKKYSRRADPTFYDQRLETMKDNFIRSVEGTLGAVDEEGFDVIEMLRQLPSVDFYNLYEMENQVFSFELWDSEGQVIPSVQEVLGKLNEMSSILKRYYEGKINMDLRNF